MFGFTPKMTPDGVKGKDGRCMREIKPILVEMNRRRGPNKLYFQQQVENERALSHFPGERERF
jgi:hypothetical protein